jgi:hypothetical protein
MKKHIEVCEWCHAGNNGMNGSLKLFEKDFIFHELCYPQACELGKDFMKALRHAKGRPEELQPPL